MKNLNLKIMRPNGFHSRINSIVDKAQKNVEKKSGWKLNNNCPICNSNKKKIWLKKIRVDIYECLECQTGYSKLTPKNLSEIYDMGSEIEDKISSHKKRSKYFLNKFGIKRVKFIQNFKKKGDLLDYGCGTGEFVNLAKNYFNVSAFDYSLRLTEFVKSKYKIRTYSELDMINKKFDIITLYDVLEHVEKPLQVLKNLNRMLKKNGIIIIYSPNKNSFGFDILQEKSNLCTAPFHLTYFNNKTIAKYLEKIFDVVFLKTFGLDLVDIFSFIRDSNKLELSKSKIDKYFSYQNLFDKIGYSNHLRIVLKKKK